MPGDRLTASSALERRLRPRAARRLAAIRLVVE